MKKLLTLLTLALLGMGSMWANYGVVTEGNTVTITWDFGEYIDQVDTDTQTYEGLTCVLGSSSDYIKSSVGFRPNGTSTATTRHIKYTPEYSGTMTIYYKSNNSSATDRIVAIGTKVTTGTSLTVGKDGIIAFGNTAGSTVQNISGDLSAGTTYYFYNANGGCAIKQLVYTYTVASANAPLITTQPQSATYEKDATAEALTVAATAYADGALSYQWYSNSSNSTTTGTAIEGATNNSYTPSTETVGTTYYYCKVTEADNEDVATSSVATITVNAPACAEPTFTLGSYNYEEEGYEVIANCATEGATLTYKIGNGSATACTAGVPFYAKGGKLIITASKEGYSPATNASDTQYTLNGAPSATSPETLIPFNTSSDKGDKDITHTYKSVSIVGGVFAGINGAEGLKLRTNQSGNTLTLNVNKGYIVTAVEFKARSNNKAATIDISGVTIDGKPLANFEAVTLPVSTEDLYTYNIGDIEASQSIVFTFDNSNITGEDNKKNYQIHANITVTYEQGISVNISSAGYATFSNASEVAVPDGVTAYYATLQDESTVLLNEITSGIIPAAEGVVLEGAEGTYTFAKSATSAANISGNLLKANLTAGEPAESEYFTLAAGPKFVLSDGGTLAAGKAYLVLPTQQHAREMKVSFHKETTGITTVENTLQNNSYYNINGQRVAQPTKGLYIMNGKKVLVK